MPASSESETSPNDKLFARTHVHHKIFNVAEADKNSAMMNDRYPRHVLHASQLQRSSTLSDFGVAHGNTWIFDSSLTAQTTRHC